METNIISSDGRITRSQFWTRFFIISLARIIIVNIILGNTFSAQFWQFLVSLLIDIFIVIQVNKRMHDVNKSGWYQLIPIYNLILCFTDGTSGINDYGDDPKGREGMQEAAVKIKHEEKETLDLINNILTDKNYFVRYNNQIYGPYPLVKMKSLLKQGKINSESEVRFEVSNEWKKLVEFNEVIL